ncbi:hypothetical protein C5167_043042 [Papaver somniferum]|uniref:Uncharacterized protein n=1 Tax=Papaver somniferum TaxID=3469 RepID=A0A4Y7L4J8_PAPSO|nr:hypothetical protein C5167_043042 [Papaver somniferum]
MLVNAGKLHFGGIPPSCTSLDRNEVLKIDEIVAYGGGNESALSREGSDAGVESVAVTVKLDSCDNGVGTEIESSFLTTGNEEKLNEKKLWLSTAFAVSLLTTIDSKDEPVDRGSRGRGLASKEGTPVTLANKG